MILSRIQAAYTGSGFLKPHGGGISLLPKERDMNEHLSLLRTLGIVAADGT